MLWRVTAVVSGGSVPVRGACGVSGALPPRPARPCGQAAHARASVRAKSEAVLMRDILYGVTTIRRAVEQDADPIWSILEPVIRAGETYTLPRDMTREAALAYWFEDDHEVFVAEEDGEIVGTYFLRPNQKGGGSHVANCGYITAVNATGRGIARVGVAIIRHGRRLSTRLSARRRTRSIRPYGAVVLRRARGAAASPPRRDRLPDPPRARSDRA